MSDAPGTLALAMVQVRQAGIDTWSPCWYVGEDSPAHRAMEALATQPVARGRLIPDEIAGHRVGWFPSSRLVYAEGHPGEGGLGHPDALMDRLSALSTAIRDVGVPLPEGRFCDEWVTGQRRPGLAGVRRLDATVDVGCDSPEIGLALLAGVAAVSPNARLDRDVRYNGAAIGTVSWMGKRGKVARVYDWGLAHNEAVRGTVIRLEAQYRWAHGFRRDPAELSADYVRDKWQARFAPLWKATNGIKVVGRMALVDEVRDAIEAGEITAAQGEQILAFQLLTARSGGRAPGYHERTRRRREALVRSTGLVVGDGLLDETEIDLQDILGCAFDTEVWECQG